MRSEQLQCKCGNAHPNEFRVFYEIQVGYDLTVQDGEVRAIKSTRDLSDIESGWAHIYCAVCNDLVFDLETDMLPYAEE